MPEHIHSTNNPKAGCPHCENLLDRGLAMAERELTQARSDYWAATRMVEVANREVAKEQARFELIEARIRRLTALHERTFAPSTPEEVPA